MPPPLATGAPAKAAIKAHRAVAFFTSADGSHCLVGMVASTPTITQSDGTIAVLVQPRPLILVAPQRQQDASKNGGLVTGHLVSASDPCVGGLITTAISSPRHAKGNSSAAPSLNVDDVGTVMPVEELREMLEHRDILKEDLGSSKARVRAIDELLRDHTQQKHSSATAASAPNPLQAPPPLKEHLHAARKTVDVAAKAARIAEKELLLARAGLRTVKPLAWIDLQRRRSVSSSQLLVSLIETAVAPLHDRMCASFDDVVMQAASLPKRLAAVKPMSVTVDDTQRTLRFLKAWPAVAAVEKEHKTAAALYRWVVALTKAAEAQQHLSAAQKALAETASQSPGTARQSKAMARSSEPLSQPPQKLGSVAEAALRKERRDYIEYVQMAEDELAALDALIAEAEALTTSSCPNAQDSPEGAKTIVPALVVPASWVVCALPVEETPLIEACTHQPLGKSVEFSSSASLMLSSVTKPQDLIVPELSLAEMHKESSVSEKKSNGYRGTGVNQSTSSPRTAATAPTGAENAALVSVTEIAAARKRAEDAEEKTRLLEARLSAALQQNPREMEVQLLRDELDAKRTELHRVTEERDRLLQERCERSSRYASNAWRSMADGAYGDDTSQSGSGQCVQQPSTPRDTVDRSVVEELEDQLTAAHQRISELLIEVGESSCRPPTLAALFAAQRVVKSGCVTSAQGDRSHISVRQSPSAEGINSTPHSTSGTPWQRSPRGTVVSPGRLPSLPTITPDMYDDLQARLCAVSAELEAQRQGTHRLEEQLNDALHRKGEAEQIVSAQQHELEEVWEKLEAAEARAEEQHLLTQQRLFLTQAQYFPSQSHLSQPHMLTPLSSSSTMANTNFSQTQKPLLTSASSPTPHTHLALSVQDAFTNDSTLGAADAEVRSQVDEDAMTAVTNANTACGSASPLSMDVYSHSLRSGVFPTFGGGSGGVAAVAAAGTAADPSVASPYSRGPSALQSRPVEKLSMIELRHEVHRLREEMERYQSGELRMAMELQTLREKQKAERKRRRDARAARMQMLVRMQGNIAGVIERSTNELEAIPVLLERCRAEAEALMETRRMGR
ncbi:hypothetical protein NXY56_005385 [Leishmania guyanensis]